ncbi:MAG: hypothetical protein SNG27_07625 [Rikenellaceae bacterium]
MNKQSTLLAIIGISLIIVVQILFYALPIFFQAFFVENIALYESLYLFGFAGEILLVLFFIKLHKQLKATNKNE